MGQGNTREPHTVDQIDNNIGIAQYCCCTSNFKPPCIVHDAPVGYEYEQRSALEADRIFAFFKNKFEKHTAGEDWKKTRSCSLQELGFL